MISMHDFLKKINTSGVVRGNIPMGLGMGFPMLNIVGDKLLVSVFYYRSILRPEDKTLLMPPEYALSVEYPSGRLASFRDLRLYPPYANINFENPVGTFRHEAIQSWSRAEYKEKKEELYASLDRLVAFLGGEGEFTSEDEKALSQLYSAITEPPLHPFYKSLAPQFFERYIEKKGNGNVS